jgi:hypothetical protein
VAGKKKAANQEFLGSGRFSWRKPGAEIEIIEEEEGTWQSKL